MAEGRPCKYSPGIPLYVVGKLPSRGRVKRVSVRVDELRDTMSRVDSATADRVWKRSEVSLSLLGVGVVENLGAVGGSVFTICFVGA